jgi:hypothetical protein
MQESSPKPPSVQKYPKHLPDSFLSKRPFETLLVASFLLCLPLKDIWNVCELFATQVAIRNLYLMKFVALLQAPAKKWRKKQKLLRSSDGRRGKAGQRKKMLRVRLNRKKSQGTRRKLRRGRTRARRRYGSAIILFRKDLRKIASTDTSFKFAGGQRPWHERLTGRNRSLEACR